MKISSRPPTGRSSASAGVSPAARLAETASATNVGGPQAAVPTTSLMGIPADEVTPKVRIAIEALMREVERLRKDVDEMRRRTVGLEKLADEDALLPVVNRRAFVRELSRECQIFCVSVIWFVLPERSKDDEDFKGATGRIAEGLRAA